MAGTRRPKKVDGRTVKMSTDERAERNAVILQMFLMARSEAQIARHPQVQLSQPTVHNIIRDELKRAAKRRELLQDQSLTIWVERFETLIYRCWPKVAAGDLKAIEVGRRLLETYARINDMFGEGVPGGSITPPMSDDELDMVEDGSPAFEALDDLTKYRLRAHREGQQQQRAEP